ncbi:MAG: hypothetical protein AAF975_09360 [Spirochaetota bacterium]
MLGYTEALPYGLETGEVALYSEHGQVLFLKDDGSVHLEAAGKVSIHSDQEDLYSLLKELLGVIKGLQTAQIDTQVNGGSVTLAPSGTAPIAGASGTNPGVGLAASSTQKLDQVARRLDKLLQKGEKPQSAEKQERKREEALRQAKAQQDFIDGLLNGKNTGQNAGKVDDLKNKLFGPGSVSNNGSRTVYAILSDQEPAYATGTRAVSVAPGQKYQGFVDAVVDLAVPLIVKVFETSHIIFNVNNIFTINPRDYGLETWGNNVKQLGGSNDLYGVYVGKIMPSSVQGDKDQLGYTYFYQNFWQPLFFLNNQLKEGRATYNGTIQTTILFKAGDNWANYARRI